MSEPQAPRGASGLMLQQLVSLLERVDARLDGDGEVRVKDVSQDSRKVSRGCLFVARQGAVDSGLTYVDEAIVGGAVAILLDAQAPVLRVAVPVIRVTDLPLALALAAEAVHGWPSRGLSLVGITGTNGKTTLTWLLASLLSRMGLRCGQIGTLGASFEGVSSPGSLTTPEADVLSRTLAEMKSAGATHVVMEVSSVALVKKRVAAVQFDVSAFTNFTRDHLDLHGTVKAYLEAKTRLFTECEPRVAVVNVEDSAGRSLADSLSGAVVRVGRGAGLDIDVSGLHSDRNGIEGSVTTASRAHSFCSPLLGEHNIENLSVLFGILSALGVDLAAACEFGPQLQAPPGRLERCDESGDDCVVLVDYAHTPDALRAVLDTLRNLAVGRLVCVFGCGGDRDPGKRAPMGRTVAERAELAIVTSDNPRSEDPGAIAELVAQGVREAGGEPVVELDRNTAIRRAIVEALAGDLILIAGKGHETYQLIGSRTIAFDDREQARYALALRREANDS